MGWGRPRPQYSRFQKTGNDFRTAWAQNPGTRRLVYFGVGAFGVYYVSNLERVPVCLIPLSGSQRQCEEAYGGRATLMRG